MDTLSRRRFLVITGVGVVAVAAGGVALAVRQLAGSGQGNSLSFQAVTGLPDKPLLSYASYVINGKVNVSNGTGTITKYVYAGPPKSMTNISLLTRTVRVTAVSQQESAWHIRHMARIPSWNSHLHRKKSKYCLCFLYRYCLCYECVSNGCQCLLA